MENPIAKVMGAQRSGNNFIQWALRHNYHIALTSSSHSGDKHGAYNVEKRLGHHVHLILTAKHPLAWLVSVYKWDRSRHRAGDMDFETYIRQGKALGSTRSPIQHWNKMYNHWLNVNNGNCYKIIVRHWEIVKRPKVVLRNIGKKLGLKMRRKNIQATDKRMTTKVHPGKNAFNRDYYNSKKYLDYYTPGLMTYVHEHIDWSLVKRMRLGGREDGKT